MFVVFKIRLSKRLCRYAVATDWYVAFSILSFTVNFLFTIYVHILASSSLQAFVFLCHYSVVINWSGAYYSPPACVFDQMYECGRGKRNM